MGLKRTSGGRDRGAFNGHGWKAPALLRPETAVTLSVPPRLRGRVGFVYSLEVQERVWHEGAAAAAATVVFPACPAPRPAWRLGWPGGVVVDGPRCATLVLRVAGEPDVTRHRVSLGQRCR